MCACCHLAVKCGTTNLTFRPAFARGPCLRLTFLLQYSYRKVKEIRYDSAGICILKVIGKVSESKILKFSRRNDRQIHNAQRMNSGCACSERTATTVT
jgi:hypothetical protein